MRILVDTNVLLRSVEPGCLQHQTSVQALGQLRQLGHELLTVPQVLYEFWSVATRPVGNNGLGMTPSDAHAELGTIQRLFPLLRDERAIFPIWEQLVLTHGVQGKQAHDARLAAAMQRHGITSILTFNTADFARFPFLSPLPPDDVVSGAWSG